MKEKIIEILEKWADAADDRAYKLPTKVFDKIADEITESMRSDFLAYVDTLGYSQYCPDITIGDVLEWLNSGTI